jgi:hypothetical protein
MASQSSRARRPAGALQLHLREGRQLPLDVPGQTLKGFAQDDHPKVLIETLSEDLLVAFAKLPLLDHYDIYQHLMDYWAETMQDDCYLITADGWREAAKPRLVVDDKNKKAKEGVLKPRSVGRCPPPVAVLP